MRRLLGHIPLRAGTPGAVWMDALYISGAVFVGLFPRAAKNLWALLAGWQSARAKHRGEAKQAWIDETIAKGEGNVAPLPARSYSWEVVGTLGGLPILLVIVAVKVFGVAMSGNIVEDFTQLLIAVYSAQIVVLWYANKTRGFVYKEKQPAHLVNKRLCLTLTVTVLIPITFGVFWYGWLITAQPIWIFAVGWLLATFPYHCSSLLFLLARWRNWYDPQMAPELDPATGMPTAFFVGSSFVVIALATAIVMLYTLQSDALAALAQKNAAWLQYWATK